MRKHKLKSFFNMVLFFIMSWFVCGCGFFSIEQRDNVGEVSSRYKNGQEIKLYNSCVIMGKVINKNEHNYPVMILAHSLSFKSKIPTDFVILAKPGSFMLYVPEGSYHVYAIMDFNNDAVFEESEVAGVYGRKKPIKLSLRKGEVKKGIVIKAKRSNNKKIQLPQPFKIKADSNTVTQKVNTGQIAKIYDEIFSKNNASTGWWNPSTFMKAFGANIYFSEKYDPKKIPILFVHGAKGSPQDWVYFFIRLNRKKFQPWFYYYPSGIRLTLSARLLYEKLLELQKKYKINKMCITAHSMGGLITRSMLTQYNFHQHEKSIKLYVTIATPWSGFKSVDNAHFFSDTKLPSWLDIGSRSFFIKRILRTSLPQSINYYMFYGKLDSVSEGGALDNRVFKDAKGKYAFDCDHDTILSNRNVFIKYNSLLKKELLY